ncbi:MAG: 3-dehydroquinate synthase [Alphaproteobacteria bacterium]|nr:3-dehydroquinate synthase [Alphaproteobacteria bacterium]MCD8526436.1 3-dehydroquinate synthase [Alphaproteobacteria bacterium]MCD8571511.1 3-dehydroquinate synthase [Alphaproteobacteria bacterium]
MASRIVSIELGERSYDIYVGGALLPRIAELLPMDVPGGSFFIVSDENVKTYAGQVQTLLKQSGARVCESLILKPGEQTKSFAEFEKTCRWMLSHGVDRKSTLVAVGGGVVGDLGGYAAASVMRGINFVQVPTTLLAQVDSSVGGKTGINVPEGKNLVGAFYQPKTVVADIDTLKTLPRRELLAGYAEIAKYGLLGDYAFFQWLEEHGRDVCALETEALSHAIEKSVEAKAAIVAADEREQGRRALLNLGHTFGHALEAAAGYDGRLLHGEAVAIGMVMAFDLSVRTGLCPAADLARVEEHLISVGLPTRASFIEPGLNTTPEELLEIMRRDKKAEKGSITLVLADGIGRAFTSRDASEEMILDVLSDSLGGEANARLLQKWKAAFAAKR